MAAIAQHIKELTAHMDAMTVLTQKIQDLTAHAGENGHSKIPEDIAEGPEGQQEDLPGIQQSLGSELDFIQTLSRGPMQLAMSKIGGDLEIFQALKDSAKPLTVSQLAETSGAATGLLSHILRTQAAFGLIKETGKDEFTANRVTKVLADVNVAGAVTYVYDNLGFINQALAGFVKEKKHQNITSGNDTVFQKAFNTNLGAFEWMSQHQDHMQSLGHLMALQRGDDWIESFPVEKEVGSFSAEPEQAILVDVGGGFGQQAIAFKSKFPNLPGRLIVQEIPSTLAGAQPVDGIELVEHDFFQPQPIKEAKFYYFRHVLHNWPEAECIKILQATIPALGPHSRIILDEVVLPDVGVPWQAAYMDITMMSLFGAVERTKTEWETLIDKAGLKILDIHQYDSKMLSAVIVAVPK